MQRSLSQLAHNAYDLLIVGGGIYGACVAWEAVSRGLSVALVEKGDFGGATSANSLKIIHGGLRYLQHADFKRMRESIRERKALLKIAPHLIHPLPILVPTYGHGVKGREAMAIALLINDVVSGDRNWAMPDPGKHLPAGRVISKADCLAHLPGLTTQGLTGGALFCDAQVYNSERLTLAFLRSAHQAGAAIANYARVTGFLKQAGRVMGATVRDELTGAAIEVRANLVINTAGPWIHQIKDLARSPQPTLTPPPMAKAVNLVVPAFIQKYAVGLSSKERYRDQDALVDKGGRFLFTAPWRGRSMVGTWYFPHTETPESPRVTEAELHTCIDDINAAYPPANLGAEDVLFVHCGLLPSRGLSAKTGDVQLEKHYHLQDHSQQGLPGLFTVSGVKYTTARDVAEKVVNRVGALLQRPLSTSQTRQTPVQGGDIPHLEAFIAEITDRYGSHLSTATLRHLAYNYGTECTDILRAVGDHPDTSAAIALLTAQIHHAVHYEMAHHLSDVVLRRTDLGSAGQPDEATLAHCADVMAALLEWDEEQRTAELEAVHQVYATQRPAPLTAKQTVLEA